MAETSKINDFKINVLTQAQYSAAEKDENQIYLITDTSVASLPNVSTTDNGKFLRVVSGQWTAVTLTNAEEATFGG